MFTAHFYMFEKIKFYIVTNSHFFFFASLVVLTFVLASITNAQEVPIESVGTESSVVEKKPVDSKALVFKTNQESAYAETGKYIQIRRGGGFDGGVGRQALLLASVVDDEYEIHVYEAPCGMGWKLIKYTGRFDTSPLGIFEIKETTVYGCEA